MTVAILIQVNDGIVLASDSAMTLVDPQKSGPESILNVYNNANKIYNLRKGLPIAGMVYGAGSIGASSLATIAKDLRARFSDGDTNYAEWHIDPKNYTIEDVANKVKRFIFDECYGEVKKDLPDDKGIDLGFVVCGYSSGAQLSESWLISIANGECSDPQLIMDKGVSSWYAGGDPDVCCRIGNGYSQKLLGVLQAAGLTNEQIEAVLVKAGEVLPEPLVAPPMPIQDAIELAEFFVHSTAIVSRFRRWAATVGGPIESAAITKHEGFKWVRRKHYFDIELNPIIGGSRE